MNASAQFTAVMRAPLVRIIDEQSVTFPLLASAELGELGEVIRAEWWDAAKKNESGKNFTPLQWFRVEQEINEAVLPITEIIRRVGTLSGSAWCVDRSLKKAGYDEAARVAILESMPPMTAVTGSEIELAAFKRRDQIIISAYKVVTQFHAESKDIAPAMKILDEAVKSSVVVEPVNPGIKEIAELVSRIRFLPKAKPTPDAGDNVNRPLPQGGEQQAPAQTGEQSPSNSSSSESTQAA